MIFDGIAFAQKMTSSLQKTVISLDKKPVLLILLAKEDKKGQLYTNLIVKKAKEVGIYTIVHSFLLANKDKNLLKGAIYVQRKEYGAAITKFLSAGTDEAYLRLSHVYLETDNIKKALYYCELACRKRKYDVTSHKLLAMFYSRMGILIDENELMRKSQDIEETRKAS